MSNNKFFNFFLFVLCALNFSKHLSTGALQLKDPVTSKLDTDVISRLIAITFNGYNCLNILIHKNAFHEDRTGDVIKAIHVTDSLSIRLIESLANAIHHCGFLVISNDTEKILDFTEVRYDDVIRVLYVNLMFFPSDYDDNDDDILQLDVSPLGFTAPLWHGAVASRISTPEKVVRGWRPQKTDEVRLHDMDLALVKLSVWEKNIKIFIKTRYENKTRGVDQDFSKPFFHSKDFIPRKVNYDGRIVRYMVFDFPLFTIVANDTLVGGIEKLIYDEVEKKLNFTAVVSTPKDGITWGLAFPNGTITGGILKKIYERKVDIGFCGFWMDFSKVWVGTFSTYWEFECLQYLIPKPKWLPPHWKNILKPLPRKVWVLVLLGLINVAIACYLLGYVEDKMLLTSATRGVNILTEFLTVAGIFLLAKNPEKNHGQSVNRHIYMWWSLFSLLITTLYSSSLVSHLTYPQFEPMIETVEGLVKAGYYWGTDYPLVPTRYMDVENPWHAAFIQSYKREKNTQERVSRLRDGNYSILTKIVGQTHFMEVDAIPVEMLRDLRTSRECHFFFYVAFVLRKAFPLTLINDQIIKQLMECGIIQYWLDRLFAPKYPLTTFTRVYEYKTPPEEIELTPLRVANLQGAFWIFVIGNQIACITFVCEICVSKRKAKMCSH